MNGITAGIISGFAAAVCQALSFTASAKYMSTGRGSLRLFYVSSIWQGIFAIIPLIYLLSTHETVGCDAIGGALCLITTYAFSQVTMLRFQRYIEPSKVASLMGLKIPLLAVICWIGFKLDWKLFKDTSGNISLLLAAAIALTVFGAWLMNKSGGMHLPLKGFAWLMANMLFAAACDLSAVKTSKLLLASGYSNLTASFVAYCTLSVVLASFSGVMLAIRGKGDASMKHSFVFSALWFGAMSGLYFCLSSVGPVKGAMIQSSRGIMAIVIGLLVAKYSTSKVESKISTQMWIRRAIGAAIMTIGIIICILER